MAKIILIRKNQVLGKHLIPHSWELTIGRNSQNQIVIDHMSVSGRHAKIMRRGDELILTDLGSTNGTFVNNERVCEARLAHQDWITVGNHVLIVDLYESLSLESTVKMLMAAGPSEAHDADQTVMFDMMPGSSTDFSFNTLTFISGGQGDYELFKNKVTIGKNEDADIVINGFFSFMAGSPAAAIVRKTGGDYSLEFIQGLLKPKVNGLTVKKEVRLKNGDTIRIGPVQMQINLKSR